MGGFQSFSTKKSAWDLVRLSPTTLSQTFVRHQPQKPCSCWTWWRDLQAWQHLAAVIDWEEHRSHMIGLIGFRGICMIYVWNVLKIYDVFNCFYVWPIIYLKNSEDVSRHALSLSCMPLPFRSAELPHSGDVSPGLLVVNDDSWSRCATALRRTHQHANPSPLMWLCGDAREAACLALIDDNC